MIKWYKIMSKWSIKVRTKVSHLPEIKHIIYLFLYEIIVNIFK